MGGKINCFHLKMSVLFINYVKYSAHCLSATNLGNQYVFVTQKALSQVKILRHCYLCEAEKQSYISVRYEDSRVSNDKVKIARKQYRGQGKYIEEILE